MALRNTKDSWGSLAKFFHWAIAILIIAMLLIGLSFSFIDSRSVKSSLMVIHKSTGVCLLILVVLRLLWRWVNPVPKLPASTPQWQQKSAHLSHWLFYIALIVMPLAGLFTSASKGYGVNFFWLFSFKVPFPKSDLLHEIFENMHLIFAWIIVALMIIHILGALRHHMINKDHVLKRMMPGAKSEPTTKS